MENLLEVNDLQITFHTYAGKVQAVRGVNFDVKKGGSRRHCWGVRMRQKCYSEIYHEITGNTSSRVWKRVDKLWR